MKANDIIELRRISLNYDTQTILNGFDLRIRDGEFFTLLGPSGCGKTTLLRLIAGFERCDEGAILLDGQDITGIPAEKRPVNTVFQSYALFPHLTVFDNVAFGLRMQKCPKEELETRVMEVLEMVQLKDFAKRKPAQLSGGQKQRVAIARAVVNRPRLLLLDESLSALDYKLRQQMQLELKRLQRQLGITFVYVTHDQEEALSMSDRIAVLNYGQLQQVGPPRDIYETPANEFVARFIGEINVFDAEVLAHIEGNRYRVSLGGAEREVVAELALSEGDRIKVLLRPEDLRVAGSPEAFGGAGFFGKVVERNYRGKTLDSVIRIESGQDLLASEFFDEDDPDFDYELNEKVWVDWVHGWEHVIRDQN